MIKHSLTVGLQVKQGKLEATDIAAAQFQATNSLLLNQPVPWRLTTEIFKKLVSLLLLSSSSNHTNKKLSLSILTKYPEAKLFIQAASHYKDPLKCFSTALLQSLYALRNIPQYLKLLFFLTLNQCYSTGGYR